MGGGGEGPLRFNEGEINVTIKVDLSKGLNVAFCKGDIFDEKGLAITIAFIRLYMISSPFLTP